MGKKEDPTSPVKPVKKVRIKRRKKLRRNPLFGREFSIFPHIVLPLDRDMYDLPPGTLAGRMISTLLPFIFPKETLIKLDNMVKEGFTMKKVDSEEKQDKPLE